VVRISWFGAHGESKTKHIFDYWIIIVCFNEQIETVAGVVCLLSSVVFPVLANLASIHHFFTNEWNFSHTKSFSICSTYALFRMFPVFQKDMKIRSQAHVIT